MGLLLWNELIKNYIELLQERLDRRPLLLLGEDSIRYDFFMALIRTYDFKPSQINIEVPINNQCFVPARKKFSLRNEKPLIDLVVVEDELKISVEFGLFRENSNSEGTINKTARMVKMLNDMLRVSLESYFTKTTGLFVCVADYKMLGHRLRSKILERFPSDYRITNAVINHQLGQRTNKIDGRFLKIFQPFSVDIVSSLIVEHRLTASKVKNETRLLVWQVTLEM